MGIINKIRYDNRYTPQEDEFISRVQAYKLLFQGATAEIVIRDLIQFCRYNDDEVSSDGILNGHKAGLQSVVGHIDKMLNTDEEYFVQQTEE